MYLLLVLIFSLLFQAIHAPYLLGVDIFMKNSKELSYIGSRIRKIRLKSGLTQEQLGEKANLHYSYIGQVERGDKLPSLKTLKKISEALNISLDYILEPTEKYSTKSERELLQNELLSLCENKSNEEIEIIINLVRNVFDQLEKLKEIKQEHAK